MYSIVLSPGRRIVLQVAHLTVSGHEAFAYTQDSTVRARSAGRTPSSLGASNFFIASRTALHVRDRLCVFLFVGAKPCTCVHPRVEYLTASGR